MGDKFDPTKVFEIGDIALWESKLSRFAEHEPGKHDGKIVLHHMRAMQAELLDVVDREGVESRHLRAVITFGVRAATEQVSPEDTPETKRDAYLYEVEASLAAQYRIVGEATDDQIRDFVAFNCVHNVWPFWRYHVFDALKRASLPVPAIPFFAGRSLPDSGGDNKHVEQSDTEYF